MNIEEERERGRWAELSEAVVGDFAAATRVHDWRNYIPERLRDRCVNLSIEAKIAAYEVAEDAESN